MKFSAVTAAFLASVGPVLAYPTVTQGPAVYETTPSLEPRQGAGLYKLALLISDLLSDGDNAFDPEALANGMIAFTLSTVSGGNCNLDLDSGANQHSTGVWNVCFLDGEQYFHDDTIGDFSVTFTQAGGQKGNTEDGLHTPVLKVATIDNWAPIYLDDYTWTDERTTGNLCQRDNVAGTERLQWNCGIPGQGAQYYGISNTEPVEQQSYTPGWCGLHFYDYQIPEGDSQYYTAIAIKDANGVLIGQIGNAYSAGDDRVSAAAPVVVSSNLPAQLIYNRPGVSCAGSGFDPATCDPANPDDAAITFQYNGATWTSKDSVCSTGGYENGYRQGDCGFTC